MSEQTRAVAKRYYEVFGSGPESLDSIVNEDFVGHAGAGTNRDELKKSITAFLNSFPDLTAELDHVVAEDDKVSTWVTYKGTHRGEFAGVPGTGRQVEFPGWDHMRISGSRIAEMSSYCDVLSILTQIGALPELGKPAADVA
jgi:steroid delta-isomerase-like uncharacterized protein